MPATCLLRHLIYIVLTVVMTIGSAEGPSRVDPNETMHFVVANRGGCSVSLPSTASVVDLYKSVKDICNINSTIEIQLLRETIANWQSSSDQMIHEISILRSLMNDKKLIWGPGYRIPIHLHRSIPSETDCVVYASLSQMFGQTHSNLFEKDWYRFVLECLESRSCLVEDLCERFAKIFYCDGNEITMLNLQGEHLNGSIDISKIPRTVQKVLLERNAFSNITGLNRLSGTALKYLDVRGNPSDIDLRELSKSSPESMNSPLRLLRLNLRQISQCTVGVQIRSKHGKGYRMISELAYSAVFQWIRTSVLDAMIIGRTRPKYIHKDGRFITRAEQKNLWLLDPKRTL